MMWKHFIRIVHFDAEGMIVEWIRWWCGFGWLFGSIVWISGRFGHYQDYYQSEKDCFIFVYIKVYRFITCDDAMMMMIRMTKYQNQTQVHDDHDGNGSKRPHTAALSFFDGRLPSVRPKEVLIIWDGYKWIFSRHTSRKIQIFQRWNSPNTQSTHHQQQVFFTKNLIFFREIKWLK